MTPSGEGVAHVVDTTQAGTPPRGRRLRLDLNNPRHFGALLVTPIQLFLLGIGLFPLLAGIYISLMRWLPNLGTEWWDPSTFAGLRNYVDAFADPAFISSFTRTLIFLVVVLAVETVLGLAIALVLWRKFIGNGLVTALLLIPMLMVPAVVGYTFFMIFQQTGAVNALLEMILRRDVEIEWLTDPKLALVSVMIMDIWQWTPLLVLIFLAGLVALPKDQLHAAEILRASPWQVFRWNLLPMLKPILLVAVIIRGMEAFKTFDPVLIATGGGPGDATRLISLHLYKQGFQSLQFSLAAAESFLTLLVVAVAALFALRVFSSRSRSADPGRFAAGGRRAWTALSSVPRALPSRPSNLEARLGRAAVRAPRLSARGRNTVDLAGRYGVSAVILALFLFPLFWIATIAFKPAREWTAQPLIWLPNDPTLDNFRVLFDPTAGSGEQLISVAATPAIVNSLIAASLGTLIAVTIGTTAAYAIARFGIGGSALPFGILMLRMMPPIILLVPLVLMWSTFGLTDTRIGLALLYGLFTSPFAVWLMKSFFDEIPREIDEAAMLDGFSLPHIFFRKILPLARGGLAVTALFCFILNWSDFALAFLITQSEAITIPVQLQKYVQAGGTLYGPRAALGLIAILPAAIFGLAIRRHLVRGLSFGAIKR